METKCELLKIMGESHNTTALEETYLEIMEWYVGIIHLRNLCDEISQLWHYIWRQSDSLPFFHSPHSISIKLWKIHHFLDFINDIS